MPIFDYRCESCGHAFEALQKLGDEPLTVCEACGLPQLKKLLSAPPFHLKGKGWRTSAEGPKKPNVRPRYAHTLDSPTPHAEHSDDHSAKPGHSHDHAKQHDHGGGVGRIVRDHVHSSNDGHTRGHSHAHSHSHSHSHGGKGHKHD